MNSSTMQQGRDMTQHAIRSSTNIRWSLMRASAVLFAATVTLHACAEAPAAEQPDDAVAVAVESVTDDRVAQPVVATGTFGSRDDIPLAFKIGGVIARLAVDEGQNVRRGQLLAALDLREIDALVAKANVAFDKAVRDEARIHRLFDDSVATRANWQDAQSQRDAARSDLEAARVNRDYAVIVAPQDGIVLRRNVTAGSNIAGGTPVLLLGGLARGRVLRVGLPDRDALRTRVGDTAIVRFDALRGESFRGTVTLVGRAADTRTGTYTAEIALAGAERLPAGLVGRAEISVRAAGSARMVPVDALVEADVDSATVFTVSGDREPTAQAHRVRLTALHGDRAAVQGIDAGARVITRGAPYVTSGTRVRIVNTAQLPTGDRAR